MRMKVEELKKGYRIVEDVFGLTKAPIVPKNTVVTKEIKEALQAFLIEEVHAEPPRKKYSTLGKDQSRKPLESSTSQSSLFKRMYIHAVEQYKREFVNWQSGLPVEINNIRKFFLPLFSLLEKEPKQLLMLQNYVNKSNFLYHHSIALGLIAGYIAKVMQLKTGDVIQIALGGCLCDSGLAKEDPILLKKENGIHGIHFNGNWFANHLANSYKMLQNILSIQPEIKVAVFQHHELLDGSGYPLGVKSEKIHQYAKIFALADLYHNLVADPNSEDMNPFKALDILNHDYFGKIDIEILYTLKDAIRQLAINATVRLSDNRIGRIIYFDTKNLSKPVIQLEDGQEIVSLQQHHDVSIIEIIG